MGRVVVVGGSGVVGMRAAMLLARARHDVECLVFHRDSVMAVQRLGLRGAQADVRDRGTLYEHLEGADVVINVTASSPDDPARVRFCDEVVAKGLPNVAEVVRQLGVRNLVSCSLLIGARPEDDSFFDEESGPKSEAEEAARRALAGEAKTKHVMMRLAQVYSGDCQSMQALAVSLHEQKAAVLGGGSAWSQLVHSDDAAAALVAMATDMMESEYPVTAANNFKLLHVCDDFGVQRGRYLDRLAAVVGAPAPRRVPMFVARLSGATEEMVAEASRSTLTTNARLRQVLPQWQPRYPSFEEGSLQMRSFWASIAQTRHLVKN